MTIAVVLPEEPVCLLLSERVLHCIPVGLFAGPHPHSSALLSPTVSHTHTARSALTLHALVWLDTGKEGERHSDCGVCTREPMYLWNVELGLMEAAILWDPLECLEC